MARPISMHGRLGALLAGGRRRLRRTDWWAVLVELLVVILGILIAFELNEWDQWRQARSEEQALLQRIGEEARGDILALREIAAEHQESAANYRLLQRALTDPAAHDAYHRGTPADCNLLRLPSVRRQSAGVGGLAAGERLDLVSDPALRTLLRRADAARTFSDGQLAFFRDNFQRYAAVVEPHMRWQFTAADARCGVDIDSLRSDARAAMLLPKLYRDQKRVAHYREQEIAATAAVLQRVQCLRAGSCAGKE